MIMEKKMETTVVYKGNVRRKDNGNYYSILGLCKDNGKKMETTVACWDCIRIMGRKWKLV